MVIKFYKYQGTGNDFVIVDNRDKNFDDLTSKHIKKICDRKFGIGADGLMMLNNLDGYDFEMIYFNADGNKSSMCGNGGRCLVKFANYVGIAKNEYHFKAIDGEHFAEIDLDKIVKLKMMDVNNIEDHHQYFVLNTGSPHYVKMCNNVRDLNVKELGSDIRNNKTYIEEGINVNFVELIANDTIFVRTYERGVEDETMSCGTGVTAAALMNAHNDNGFNRVEVKTLGGALYVEFEKINEMQFANIWLCGPAELVFTGEIEI